MVVIFIVYWELSKTHLESIVTRALSQLQQINVHNLCRSASVNQASLFLWKSLSLIAKWLEQASQ